MMIFQVRIGSIQYMDQYVSLGCLLQGGSECRYQIMRKVPDKADGINKNNIFSHTGGTKTAYPAGSGVQGGKKLVFDKNIRSGQCPVERRFSRISITHQGADRRSGFFPLFALKISAAAYFFDFFL